MCECWLIERSEGMDRWSWSDAPHKNPLVIAYIEADARSGRDRDIREC